MADRSAGLIAGCDKLVRLDRLDLSGNSFSAAGMLELARSTRLEALRELNLRGNYDDGEGAVRPVEAYPELRRRFGEGLLFGD